MKKFSFPNTARHRSAQRRAAAGPSRRSTAGSSPLRHPDSTSSPACRASSASCSGREAPLRNEKAEWQWSSEYIVRNAECGMRNGSTSVDPAVGNSLWLLHPPLLSHVIEEYHDPSSSIQKHFVIRTHDG